MSRHFALLLTVSFAALVLRVHGDDKPDGDLRKRLADDQTQLLKDCKDLEQRLQTLSARLEKSDRIEDRDRLALLKKALVAWKTTNLEGRLQESAKRLSADKPLSAKDVTQAGQQQKAAADELGNFLALFAAEDREIEVAHMVQGYGQQLES